MNLTKPETVIHLLEVLASIKSGQTLSTTSMVVIEHNSWKSAAWRYYYGETRHTTIATIREILQVAVKLPEAKPYLEPALMGIHNLAVTYAEDRATVAALDSLVADFKPVVKPITSDVKSKVVEEDYLVAILAAINQTRKSVVTSAEAVTVAVLDTRVAEL